MILRFRSSTIKSVKKLLPNKRLVLTYYLIGYNININITKLDFEKFQGNVSSKTTKTYLNLGCCNLVLFLQYQTFFSFFFASCSFLLQLWTPELFNAFQARAQLSVLSFNLLFQRVDLLLQLSYSVLRVCVE